MNNLHMRAGAVVLSLIAAPCAAQTANSVKAPAGYAPVQAPCVQQADGGCLPVSATNPLPVTGGTGGGGGGDASSANQLSVQAAAGGNAAKALSVQGIAGGRPVVVDTVVTSAAADRGAVIATANAAQQLMAANGARRGFSVQNQSSGACYVNGQGAATTDHHSLMVGAGAYYESSPAHVGTGAISIACTVANAAVYAREW